MNTGSRAVKITAKTALRGNLLRSVFAVCAIIFAVFINTYVAYLLETVLGKAVSAIISSLFSFLLIFPLFLGELRFFWRMLFSSQDNPSSVFYYFSDKGLYLKCLSFILNFLIKIIPPALVLAVPVIGVKLVSKGSIFELADMSIPLWTANLSYIYVFVCVFAVMLLIIHMLKYYMAPLFFVSDENMDSGECFHMSAVISKRSMLDFISLLASLLGWILLSVTVIPLIFTLPYIITAYAVHFRFSVAQYNRHIKESAQEKGFI